MMKQLPPKHLNPASAEVLDNATLARLIEEVRNEDLSVARSYDRTHNRHNR